MERKAIHALLLSLAVITGAVTITTDAYAQTNTDRLITVVENTNNASSMLDMILAAINDGVESILAAIGSLATSVDDGLAAIDADLMAVDSDLQAIHGDLEDLHGDLSAVDSDLQAIHGDLEDIHGDLSHIDTDLVTIHDDLTTVHGDLTDMDADIESLTQTVNELGQGSVVIGTLASNAETTQQGVEANSAAINEIKNLIMQVSEKVGVVQNQTTIVQNTTTIIQKTVAPTATDTGAPLGSELHSDDDTFDVTLAAFKLNKYDATTFKTTLSFTCDAPVFMNTVGINGANDSTDVQAQLVTPLADAATRESSVMVDGRTLYNSDFAGVGADTAVYYKAVELELDPLSSFESLKVAISHKDTADDQADIGTNAQLASYTIKEYLKAIKDGSKVTLDNTTEITTYDAGKVVLFKLDASWYSGAVDAGCTLKTPTSTQVQYDERGKVVSAALTVAPDQTTALKNVNDLSFSCSGPTAVRSLTFDNLQSNFKDFIELNIAAGASPQKLTLVDSGTNTYTTTLDNPLEFETGSFTISGKIIGSDPVLVSVTYDTTTNNSCTVQSSSG